MQLTVKKPSKYKTACAGCRGRRYGSITKAWFGRLEVAKQIMDEYDLLTVRQIFYRLIAKGLLKKSKGNYGTLSKWLVRYRSIA